MKNYKWSSKNNSFFPNEMISEYIENGWDLDDAIDVSDDVYARFQSPPLGKIRSTDSEGMPCWIDVPDPTHDELLAMAEQRKLRHISEANLFIAPLQYAVDLEIVTTQEVEKLNDWKKYRILLNRIDTSTAPNIIWPSQAE